MLFCWLNLGPSAATLYSFWWGVYCGNSLCELPRGRFTLRLLGRTVPVNRFSKHGACSTSMFPVHDLTSVRHTRWCQLFQTPDWEESQQSGVWSVRNNATFWNTISSTVGFHFVQNFALQSSQCSVKTYICMHWSWMGSMMQGLYPVLGLVALSVLLYWTWATTTSLAVCLQRLAPVQLSNSSRCFSEVVNDIRLMLVVWTMQ